MKEILEKFLCKFIAHKKIIVYDGITKGLSEVCLRLNCNHKKELENTPRLQRKYKKQLRRLKK